MKPATLTVVSILLACLAIACGGKSKPTGSGTEQPVTTRIGGATAVVVPTGSVNVCADNPSPPQTGLKPTDFGYRVLTQPTPAMFVKSQLVVSGQANPFEGAFGVSIIAVGGQTIATKDYFKDNQQLAFSVQLPFSVSSQTLACVWVFERSGKDGSPINITQVPVILQP